MCEGLLPESQDRNLALTVLYLLDNPVLGASRCGRGSVVVPARRFGRGRLISEAPRSGRLSLAPVSSKELGERAFQGVV